jgi:hypothetical protein
LAHVQLQKCSVTLIEAIGGAPHQIAEFFALECLLGAVAVSGRFGDVVQAHLTASPACSLEAIVSSDGVEPGLDLLRFTQHGQLLGGDNEGLLGGVRRFGRVPEHRVAEVVEPIGIAVVEGGKSTFVPATS